MFLRFKSIESLFIIYNFFKLDIVGLIGFISKENEWSFLVIKVIWNGGNH